MIELYTHVEPHPGFRRSPRLMKSWMLVAVLSCCATVVNAAYTSLESRYQEVKQNISNDANKAYLKGLQEIDRKLLEGGLPRAVLAVRQEIERFEASGNMAEGAKSDNLDVASLVDQVESWKNARMVDLIKAYCVRLETLVTELTRSNKLEDAIKVEQRLERARTELALYEAGSLQPEDTNSTAAVASPPNQSNVDTIGRLKDIRVDRFQISATDPVAAFNSFVAFIHPHNITLRLEAPTVPIASVSYDSRTGHPRFTRQWVSGQPQPLLRQPLDLIGTTALDVLQAICDLHGLGYASDANAIVITDATDSRAIWRRVSTTAEDMARDFTADSNAASARYGRDPMRVTGPIIDISHSLTGRTTIVLYASTAIRIEMEGDLRNRDEWKRLEADIERQRARTQEYVGGRPIRRLGEPIELTPPPSTGHYLVFSVVADFDLYGRTGIRLKNGRDARWQQVYRHN